MSNQPVSGLAAAYRKKQAETVTLPSGSVALLRRPPIQIWASTGRFPQRLLAVAMDTLAKSQDQAVAQLETEKAFAAIEAADKLSMLKFMVDVVQYAFVAPRLVEGGTSDDELDPSELSPDDFNFVFQWATRGDKSQVVGKEGLTVEAVETFRDGGSDAATPDAGSDVPTVPQTTAV